MRVGVLGGMGPIATLDFCQKIYEYSTASKDQDQVRLIIHNDSLIPDRSDAILQKVDTPVPHLNKNIGELENIGVDLIVVPCNTVHFYFDKLITSYNTPIINMIELVAKSLKNKFDYDDYILIGTRGTIQSNIYQDYFEKYSISLSLLTEEENEVIYSVIERAKHSTQIRESRLHEECIEVLRNYSGKPIILGCTELSSILGDENKEQFIDPVNILAYEVNRLCLTNIIRMGGELEYE